MNVYYIQCIPKIDSFEIFKPLKLMIVLKMEFSMLPHFHGDVTRFLGSSKTHQLTKTVCMLIFIFPGFVQKYKILFK